MSYWRKAGLLPGGNTAKRKKDKLGDWGPIRNRTGHAHDNPFEPHRSRCRYCKKPMSEVENKKCRGKR